MTATLAESRTHVECADSSALSGKARDQSVDKSPQSKFVFSPRLYFSLLPSYFCFMPKCPTCGKPAEWQDNPWRPFCSERCKLIDFSRWANEEYRVPGKEINPDEI